MRSDFRMMRELDVHTKLNPDARIQRLLAFNKRLQEEPKIVQEFQDWNLALDNKLLTVNGRILDTQKIVFGRQVQVSAGPQADWSRALRDQHMLYSVHLKDWFVVVPNRLVRDAQVSTRFKLLGNLIILNSNKTKLLRIVIQFLEVLFCWNDLYIKVI